MKILSNKEYLDMKNEIDALENENNEKVLKNIDEVQFYEKILNDTYLGLLEINNCIKNNISKEKLRIKIQELIIKIGGKI
jgi:hypothetical protein